MNSLTLTPLGQAVLAAHRRALEIRAHLHDLADHYLGPRDRHNLEVVREGAVKDHTLWLPESERALREIGIPVTSNEGTAPGKEMKRG